MKKKWHDNDWLVSILAVMGLVAGVFGNILYHGGYIQW